MSDQPIIAMVENIPVNMVASKDKNRLNGLVLGRVKHNIGGVCYDRCFERLPGYIDLEVQSIDNAKTLLD